MRLAPFVEMTRHVDRQRHMDAAVILADPKADRRSSSALGAVSWRIAVEPSTLAG
jgi:hypothetical protein